MGIKDLLKCLQPLTVERNINEFKGMSIAVDASGWLHRGLYAAVEDIIDSNMKDSQLYVDFIIMRVTELKAYGVDPVLVFDGKRNYMKAETNSKREDLRQSHIITGKKLLENIKKTNDRECAQKLRREAITCFQRGLGVTHEMEINTIAALRKLNIPVIVSPYESDCQLVHLCDIGLCQAILTEDSDVLVYTAVCGKNIPIFYKFEKSNGSLQCINLDSIINFNGLSINSQLVSSDSPHSPDSKIIGIAINNYRDSNNQIKTNETNVNSKEPSNFIKCIKNFSGMKGRRMFVQFCVLAGCDYVESIQSVGINTAIQIVMKFQDIDDNYRLERIFKHFKSLGKNISSDYLQRILNAEALFHYQNVYNPITESLQTLIEPNIYNETLDDNQLFGPLINEDNLFKFGSIEDILLKHNNIDISSICRGLISIETFNHILPKYSWENNEKVKLFTQFNQSGISGLWGYRSYLMQQINTRNIGFCQKLTNHIDKHIEIIRKDNNYRNPYIRHKRKVDSDTSIDMNELDNKLLQQNFNNLIENEIINNEIDNKINKFNISIGSEMDSKSCSNISIYDYYISPSNTPDNSIDYIDSNNSIPLTEVSNKLVSSEMVIDEDNFNSQNTTASVSLSQADISSPNKENVPIYSIRTNQTTTPVVITIDDIPISTKPPLSASSSSFKQCYTNMKRKYDVVEIISKKGSNKKSKSVMYVASIKSFFTIQKNI